MIERAFATAAEAAGLDLISEHQIGRYRVDFVHDESRTVIELDGQDTHSSPDDRENDYVRSRYIQREGYSIIRFTGREVTRNPSRCMDELKQALLFKDYKTPSQAIFIDWPFLDKESNAYLSWRKKNCEDEPERTLSLSKLLDCLCTKVSSPADSRVPLINKDRCDVFLYGRPSAFSQSLLRIDTFKYYRSGATVFRVTEFQPSFTAVTMVQDIESTKKVFEDVIIIADDMAYSPLKEDDRISVVIRRDEDTNMYGFRKNLKMDYFLGWSLGLQPHEM